MLVNDLPIPLIGKSSIEGSPIVYNDDDIRSVSVPATLSAGDEDPPGENMIVKFRCPRKDAIVTAMMSEGLNFDITAQWEEMMGGGMASLANTGIGMLNKGLQLGYGTTIQQPWMNKKVYKSTNPFSFNLKLSFVATTSDVKGEVWNPCMTLMSFLYPRQLGKYAEEDIIDKDTNKVLFKKGEFVPKTFNSVMDNLEIVKAIRNKRAGEGKATSNDTDLISRTMGTMALFSIPGPSLMQNVKKADDDKKGDEVEVFIGQHILLKSCYLEQVNVKFSTALNAKGYPLSADVTVKVTCSDSMTVKNDGHFMTDRIIDSTENIDSMLKALDVTTSHLAENMVNIFKTLKTFYVGMFTGKDA